MISGVKGTLLQERMAVRTRCVSDKGNDADNKDSET